MQHLAGNVTDSRSPSILNYFESLERLDFDALLSDFVVLEAVTAWKRNTTLKQGKPASRKQVEAFEEQIKILVTGLDIPIAKMSEVLSESSDDKIERALQIAKDVPPTKIETDWRMAGSNDALHLALAENLGADHFATLDKGLKRFKGGVLPLLVDEEF